MMARVSAVHFESEPGLKPLVTAKEGAVSV
jgi:hypothetical protein